MVPFSDTYNITQKMLVTTDREVLIALAIVITLLYAIKLKDL